MSSSLTIVLLLHLPYLHGIALTSSPNQVKSPGDSVKISCQVSGYALTDYGTGWVQHPPGKAMRWIGIIWGGGSIDYADFFKSRFTISRDSSNVLYLDIRSLQTEDSAVYYCARGGAITFDYWGQGTQVTVSSGQSSEPTSLFGLSQCGSDSGEVTLGCVTAGFSPSNFLKFKWKDAAGKDLSEFTQYPDIEKDGKYSKISQIRVKASDWDANKRFTCELEYPKSDKKFVLSKPEEILHIPTLYLMNPANDELKYNQTATFACLAADFSPPQHTFTWITEENGKKNYTGGLYSFTSPPENGRHTAISYHRVPESVWKKQGTKVTCHFQHKTKNETRSVEYKIDDFDSCTEEEAAQVHIVPPSAKDLFLQKEGYLQCKITGNINDVGKHEDVKWLKGEEEVLEKSEEGVREDNSITFKLKVTFDEWHKGTVFSCEVPHRCYPGGLKISYQREKGGDNIKPSVFLMPPPEHEQSGDMTLTCYAKDFYPKEVFVSWLADDEPVVDIAAYSQNITNVIDNGNGKYSVYSKLTFSETYWEKGVVFSCVVYHESNGDGLIRMITRSIDKASQKANIVSLSMDVPQCRSV